MAHRQSTTSTLGVVGNGLADKIIRGDIRSGQTARVVVDTAGDSLKVEAAG